MRVFWMVIAFYDFGVVRGFVGTLQTSDGVDTFNLGSAF